MYPQSHWPRPKPLLTHTEETTALPTSFPRSFVKTNNSSSIHNQNHTKHYLTY